MTLGSISTVVVTVCRLRILEEAPVPNPIVREDCALGLAKTGKYPSKVQRYRFCGTNYDELVAVLLGKIL